MHVQLQGSKQRRGSVAVAERAEKRAVGIALRWVGRAAAAEPLTQASARTMRMLQCSRSRSSSSSSSRIGAGKFNFAKQHSYDMLALLSLVYVFCA